MVDIYDVAFLGDLTTPDNIADVFQTAVGEQSVSKIGLTILRDNRDSFLFTRSGNRTSIDTEFAGLGGDVDYFKVVSKILRFFSSKSSAGETKVFLKGPLGRREYRGVLRQPEEKQEKQTKGF